MAKKAKQAKEPVRLRIKELANGNKSIYLDLYRDGRREYEFLKLYLIPERSQLDKRQNAETLKAANAIKAQRVIDLANGAAGLKTSGKGKILLLDWVEIYEDSAQTTSTQKTNRSFYNLLKGYAPANMKLEDVDAAFCVEFIDHLTNGYKKKNGATLTATSAAVYCGKFNAVLNKAERKGLIGKNPMRELEKDEKITAKSAARAYLEISEVKALIETDCKKKDVKRAFLFACFCGLRCSDIKNLTWGDLKTDGDKNNIISIKQQKTGTLLYLPLSSNALRWLPKERGAEKDNIFILPPSQSGINNVLSRWAAAAGITKHISFHTSRHTFATMMLTLGADLYTTSKLLGHANISTTQIYAEIIDQKKIDAVNLTNTIFK